MAETRGFWIDAVPGVGLEIADMFDQGQDEYTMALGQILQMKDADGAQQSFMGKTGVARLQLVEEGDDITGSQRYRSYTTTVAWNKYGQSIDVTRESIEDRTFTTQLDETKDLSIEASISQEESGMQLFNGGFSTTRDVNAYRMTWYGDTQPLFSTIHATQVPGASTQSNASDTSVPFSTDNLETPLIALIEQQTDDGHPIALRGKPMVVLPPALMKEGLEITQSTLVPDTANNAINVYRNGMGVDMVTSTFLAASAGGSDTLWAVIIPQRAKLVHFTRQGSRLSQDVNIKNEIVTYTITARWADSVLDWRRTWGSQGTSAAYSS